MKLKRKIKYLLAIIQNNEKLYTDYLREKGVKIGENVRFRSAYTTNIDTSRPSLVEIGNNVDINLNFTLLTHDYTTKVFLELYGSFVNSSGKVKIGNNIYIAKNVSILKGVTIGDNCVIGYGSVVINDIPANSVVVGVPARVICPIDEYYQKRKEKSIEEAIEYAQSIVERYNRLPVIEDFWEEFPLFVSGNEVDKYPELPIKRQLGKAYKEWCVNHKAIYASFESFLNECDLKNNE